MNIDAFTRKCQIIDAKREFFKYTKLALHLGEKHDPAVRETLDTIKGENYCARTRNKQIEDVALSIVFGKPLDFPAKTLRREREKWLEHRSRSKDIDEGRLIYEGGNPLDDVVQALAQYKEAGFPGIDRLITWHEQS